MAKCVARHDTEQMICILLRPHSLLLLNTQRYGKSYAAKRLPQKLRPAARDQVHKLFGRSRAASTGSQIPRIRTLERP